jgi:flagellar biosynthesis GTPase FlhF
MVLDNAIHLLHWPDPVAWMVAGAVEGLGLSVISTAFQLWKEKRESLKIAIGTTIFYLLVVITVNVLLELGFPVVIAKALLSLLSVPAAVTIALRAQNAQLEDLEAVKAVQEAEDKKAAEERERTDRLAREERERADKLAAEQREYERRVAEAERTSKIQNRRELREHKLKLAELAAQVSVNGANSQQVAVQVAGTSETYGKYRRWPELPNDEKLKVVELIRELRDKQPKTWKKDVMNELRRIYGIVERSGYQWIDYALRDFPIESLSTPELENVVEGGQ